MAEKLDITAGPVSLSKPVKTEGILLLGPGPTNCPERVLKCMSVPNLPPLDPALCQIMDEIKDGLRYLFQTKNDLTLVVSASGHGGMDAVISNLLEPGEVALVDTSGFWGFRAADMSNRYGGKVHEIQAPLGTHLTKEDLEEALKKYRPTVFFTTHGDSSTGVVYNLEGVGDLCHKYNCLIAVDTVASIGGAPLFTDRWGLDAVYSGSQKVLASPAGLAPITFSPRAQEKILSRKTPCPVYYWDMSMLGDYWACYGRPRIYHHTACSNLLLALRESLAMVIEEGLPAMWERHSRVAQKLHKGLEDLGFKLMVEDPKQRLPNVTTIWIPEGVNWVKACDWIMDRYRIEVRGGLGRTMGKVFRIGLLGPNAIEENVDKVLAVFPLGVKNGKIQNGV